jgi:ribosomal protein S18 acetylase RimI-like enzyme
MTADGHDTANDLRGACITLDVIPGRRQRGRRRVAPQAPEGGLDLVERVLDARDYSAIETLRDGRRIEIRALRPEDRDGLIAAVGRTGEQSLYRRFFAFKRDFTEQEIAFYVNIDHVNHVALVALLEEGGRPMIVGGGRYVVSQPGQAEVAFAVDDNHQAQGIGSALMRHLAVIARSAGLRELIAEVLPENSAMLKVFERSGLEIRTIREPGVIHIVLRLS